MRTSILIAGWSLVLLLLPVERAAGQLPKDKPSAFFEPKADAGADYDPQKPLLQLNLRPNQEGVTHIYVRNPLDAEASLTVQIVSGKGLVSASQTLKVAGKTTVRVPLVADKAQLPPALPPAIGPDGKAIPAAPPAIRLGNKAHVRVLDADKKLLDDKAKIQAISLSDLATITALPSKDGKRLTFAIERPKISDATRLVGRPIPVKITARKKNGEPVEASKVAIEGNVLEGVLAIDDESAGAPKLELSLKTDTLDAGGFIDVSVDGYARAEVYDYAGSAPNPPIFNVSAPSAAIPGKPLAVRLMTTAPKGANKLSVVFKRGPNADEIRYVDSPRNERTTLRTGDNGEAIFAYSSEDWSFEFDTNGVFGTKVFAARSGTEEKGTTTVTFLAAGPKIDTKQLFHEPADPKKAATEWFAPGQRIKLIVATNAADQVDPSKVWLYLGEKPGADGKAAPGGQVAIGKPVAGGRYSAEFIIPATFTGTRLNYGAIAANVVGLIGGGESEIKVDPTPPEISKLVILPKTAPGVGGYRTAGPPEVSTLTVLPKTGTDPNFIPGVTEKEPLASYKPGDTVRLLASGFDAESGIDPNEDVVFFLGDAPGPDGKDVQTTYKRYPTKKGQAGSTDADFRYAADIVLPRDIKKETEVKVGVMFKNRAGLYGTRVATIKLDKDFNTATLTVKVTQGSADRRQPGIKVWLVDQFGAVAAEGKTDECGIAVFEKVLPGTYLVWGVKEADQNAQDYKTVVARGGDDIDVALSVKRQLAPNIQPPKQPQR